MGVTISKKTTAKKLFQTTTEQVDESTELVDEFIALTVQLEAHDAKVSAERKRLDELKKLLVVSVDESHAPDEKATLVGTNGEVEVSAKSEATSITDLATARKLLGVETFNKVAKVNLADLRAYLTPPQLEKCTVTERKGSRRIKIIG